MAHMIATFVRHGDITVDMETNGSVKIVRESTMQNIQFSLSEWCYLMKVAELHGWPMSPILQTSEATT